MTPNEFENKWGSSDLSERRDFDALLATVREEARRAALKEAANLVYVWDGAPSFHELSKRIHAMATPPRTLDDVLKELESSPYGFARNIARTAVEGLKELQGPPPEHGQRFTPFDETIRKLTEIR